MFEQVILSQQKGRKKWTVLLALVGQLAAVAVLVAIPLLTVQQLPLADLSTVLIAPAPPPPPPPPPPPAAPAARVARVAPHRFDASQVFQPKAVPKTITALPDLPQAPSAAPPTIAGVEGGVAGGQIGGVLGGVLGGVPSVAPPPPPPAPAKAPDTPPPPAAPKLLRVGGQVEAAQVISAPPPVYPVLAKEARVGGVVRLDAVIGADGHIENLKVISGPPLLIEAAMNAVKNWTYRPTILNGQPYKVETQILVNFSLG